MKLTPELLLSAYARGIFPMAESRHAEGVGWYEMKARGVLPLEAFHVPKRLARTARQRPYRLSFDEDFGGVIRACADARGNTWINDEIIAAYSALHHAGNAHSVEAWRGEELVGGLYGVALKGAFFGESMFSKADDASKLALVHLVEHLKARGYALLDAQMDNPHLKQFGIEVIPRAEYMKRLEKALGVEASFY
jgi:leucyl/phenylalanyl-tRNA--protein transferase